jgi:hypothetical protein
MRRLVIAALGAAVCALVAGCTSSGSAAPSASQAAPAPTVAQTSGSAASSHAAPAPPGCPPAFRKIVDRGTGNAKVSEHVEHSADLITCRYLIDGSGCSKASVLVFTGPNAFVDFQRWAVEAGQNAIWSHRPKQNPRPVPGIGIEADWVPVSEAFGTATERTWVQVYLTCAPRSPADRQLAIALGQAGLATQPAR